MNSNKKVFCKECKHLRKQRGNYGCTYYSCKKYYEANYVTGEVMYPSCETYNYNGTCMDFCKKEKPFEKFMNLLSSEMDSFIFLLIMTIIFLIFSFC